MAEILIVGAGPAGISAASWLESLHVPFAWSAETTGGTLRHVFNPITNFPPRRWDSGGDLAKEFANFAEELGCQPTTESVGPISTREDGIFLARDTEYRAVILATGTRMRTMGLPGEDALYRSGHIRTSTSRDAHLFTGEDVLVIGGGDAAFEGAINLAKAGARVTLACRSSPRAREYFISEVEASDAIELLVRTTLERLVPKKNHVSAQLTGPRGVFEKSFAGAFVRIGVEAALPALSPLPEFDAEGYVLVDSEQATSIPGLFAAGDVTQIQPRGIATALGQGARAAKNAASLATNW